MQLVEEVSLAHLVQEVDVQPSHLGSSPHRREFGFLFPKKKRCRGFPYRISFQKTLDWFLKGSLKLKTLIMERLFSRGLP
jgi:hypothetical protein